MLSRQRLADSAATPERGLVGHEPGPTLKGRGPILHERAPILQVSGAELRFGERVLWSGLDLEVYPGEFIAVLGANGSGKTGLLRAILGLQRLAAGSIRLNAEKPAIGYIPQHRAIERNTPLLAKDLVRFGLDGHRFGLSPLSRSARARLKQVMQNTDTEHLAQQAVGKLSGGEFQRLRVAQAFVSRPALVLADEPLSALDLQQQATITELIANERAQAETAVIFVTHDVNPILDQVDRVLYVANGKFRIGTPDEVLRSEVLSELYETPVDVLRNQGRIVVVGTHDHDHFDGEVWG